jgi:hypothetical protein
MAAEDKVVIPTGFKSKLPQTLSYPVGAEMLSVSFEGVPQFGKLTVTFWFYPKARPELLNRYSVLEIRYSRPAKSVHSRPEHFEDRMPKATWQIMVRPVPRARRYLIRTQLQDGVLKTARDWLEKNADREEEGGLGLILTFDEESELVLISEESHLGPSRQV